MLISFIIRHQLVQATSNASLRDFKKKYSKMLWISGTSELAELRQALTTWLIQYKRTNYHSDTIWKTDIGTITLNIFKQTMDCSFFPKKRRSIHSQHNKTVLTGCHKKILSCAIETYCLPKPVFGESTYVQPGWANRVVLSLRNDRQIDHIISFFVSHYWFFWGDIPYKYVFFLISWICCQFLTQIFT